jgi:hypothetical protein
MPPEAADVTLSFQHTPDDYQEAVTGAPKRQLAAAFGEALVACLLFLALAFMLFVLLGSGGLRAPLPPKALPLRVLYAAGPSALLAALFAFATVRPMLKGPPRPWERNQPAGGARSPGAAPRGAGWLALVGIFVAVMLWWVQQPSLRRSPVAGATAPASTFRISDPDLLVPLIPWAFLVAVVLLAAGVHRRRGLHKLWEVQPPLRRPHQAEFSDYGVIVSDPYVRTVSKWQAFEGFRETPNLFVLYTSPLAFLIVPKRAFADEAQINGFRGLAMNRVGKSSFLPQPGGFPVLPVLAVEAQPETQPA